MTVQLREALVELLRPGEGVISGRSLAGLGRAVLTITIVVTNLIGALAVVLIALFVVPMPLVARSEHVKLVNELVAAGYVIVAVPFGIWAGTRRLRQLRAWLHEERPPSAEEKRLVLHAPARLFSAQITLWLVAAVLFGAMNFTFSTPLGVRVLVIVVLTGIVTASCAYVITEILLRPMAARALRDGLPAGVSVPGVATRAVLAWLGGTGLPVSGLVAVGILGLAGDPSATSHRLSVAMVVLGGAALLVGLLAVGGAARATADPVASVRRALGRVRRGELGVRVPVYDGTQIGQLQLGFNEMVAGLAERERIRDTFGAYVDPEVAAHVLKEGTSLAGERVEVTAMFLDVRSFTSLAEQIPPEEVLESLNRLFSRAVQIIHSHGGRVDKFIGDGLLAVFGAPRRQPDHAAQALQSALELASAVEREELLPIGIGLNSGEVVAGNVGGSGRLEFTVIGDAVNIASRVEAATRQTGDAVLLTESTRRLLGDAPGVKLQERSGVELRGRQERVRLYAVPADA